MEPKAQLTVKATINAPVEKTWEYYTDPKHLVKWSFADETWHAPSATNDLKAGGKFVTRMEAKDGSAGFDFSGSYNEVVINDTLDYTMDDGRKALIKFEGKDNTTNVTVTFDPENENPVEFQKEGWQAILDNFKKYVETN